MKNTYLSPFIETNQQKGVILYRKGLGYEYPRIHISHTRRLYQWVIQHSNGFSHGYDILSFDEAKRQLDIAYDKCKSEFIELSMEQFEKLSILI